MLVRRESNLEADTSEQSSYQKFTESDDAEVGEKKKNKTKNTTTKA